MSHRRPMCECVERQDHPATSAHGGKRCRRTATVQLSARGENVWWRYCAPCADVIEQSGLTRALDRRELVEESEEVKG